MIDTVIVSGGMIQKDFALDFINKIKEERKEKSLFLMAADRGMDFFRETGLVPDLVDGDFDSMSREGKTYLESLADTRIVQLVPEKDDTDTQSAVNLAIKEGAKNILILGATGGRLDHFLGNLGILTLGKLKGVQIALADEQNYICLVPSGKLLQREKQFGKYVSFFPVGGQVEGLTLKGFKYPLNEYCLRIEDCGLTVSNEISEEQAEIIYEKGSLMMIMSRDLK
ncbi:thiamine diphosphokinase [Blautia sp. HCP3S3_H10_1]|uniref:thiamine diphosphokinase n=1 Tax=unclassified Blautia TaxID=2648079 RepID=UPI003F9168AE|nr:thiamine diphosphokinase [Clostridia bacterium]